MKGVTAVLIASAISLSLIATISPAAINNGPPIVFTKKAKSDEIFDVLSYPARVESKINAMIYAEGEGVVAKIIAPLGTQVAQRAHLMIVRHIDPVYQYKPMNVIAPVGGIVSQIQVTEGSRVTSGQPLLSITDPKNLRLLVEVAAQDVPYFKSKMSGDFVIPGKEKPITVHVKGISPFVDSGTGTATCELEAEGDSTGLLPGLVGQVSLKVNKRSGFVYPEHAIVYRDSETYLRVVRDGKAIKIPVKLGRKQRGEVEIISGLHENDEVIERASRYVADGEAVKVEND